MELASCPFCSLSTEKIVAQSSRAFACCDAYPITRGHTLVIPKQHVARLFDLSESEYEQVWQLVYEVRFNLAEQLSPAGFNIGVNDGKAAGQTIPHAHIHIVPRYDGDVTDPRGGVRWIIPDKAVYWEDPS